MTTERLVARVSVSLGAGAVPDVADALEHARANPTHDPVLFVRMGDDGPALWWVCHGPRLADHSFDPTDYCARGGTP